MSREVRGPFSRKVERNAQARSSWWTGGCGGSGPRSRESGRARPVQGCVVARAEFISEAGLRRGEVVLDLSQHPTLGEFGIGGDEPTGAAGAEDADGPAAAVEGVGVACLVEVANHEEGGSQFVGKLGEGEQGGANALVAGGGHTLEKGHDGVDHDKLSFGVAMAEPEPIGLSGEAEGGGPARRGAHHEDAGEIGAEGLEAQGNGVRRTSSPLRTMEVAGPEEAVPSGRGRPVLRRAHRSSATRDLPRPGSPSRMASLPRPGD